MAKHSELYYDLVESLNEAIEHAQGKRKLRTNRIYVNKPKESPDEVRHIHTAIAVPPSLTTISYED